MVGPWNELVVLSYQIVDLVVVAVVVPIVVVVVVHPNKSPKAVCTMQ